MSEVPVLRLYCFSPQDPARRSWHLAEIDPAQPGRILRFVKQRRSRLVRVREHWRRCGGPLASQQENLLTSRLAELEARSRLAAMMGPLGVR